MVEMKTNMKKYFTSIRKIVQMTVGEILEDTNILHVTIPAEKLCLMAGKQIKDKSEQTYWSNFASDEDEDKFMCQMTGAEFVSANGNTLRGRRSCKCGCKAPLLGRQKYFSEACRKRHLRSSQSPKKHKLSK
jgi:hypothetical protein